ncbi:anti-sigma factor [Methylobacterium sp. J-030]|uniref:NepR family anti-sigma factor n=1 Tax=Methylobacterium sp. J-030 TaxID=2836627 RepID=UPI001FB9E5F8|nr:NepR family anti-sigma factor [Methylobacterium sp. J-030]MCJ2072994.1 anti-sigma factor [Methylobacterium sp. J-030]
MAYVEPQHNVAGPSSATRGVWMVDQGKEAGLHVLGAHGSTASDHRTHDQDGTAGQPGRAASRGGLSEQTRNRLALQLRALYDTVTKQPVPDRFAELIAKLDSGERGKSSK